MSRVLDSVTSVVDEAYDHSDAARSAGVSNAAQNPPSDPDLATMIEAWPTLPPAIRAAAIAVVRSAIR